MKKQILPSLLLPLLSGCSTHTSIINNAFDDLVNETRSTRTSNINYKSYVSISGLVPHSAAGAIMHHPDGLSPTHGLGLSPKWSYVVESTFPMDTGNSATDFQKLKAIRDKYIEARESIIRATALQVKLALSEAALNVARNKKDLESCKLAAHLLALEEPKDKCEDVNLNAMDSAAKEIASQATTAVASAATKRSELIREVDRKNILVTRWDQNIEIGLLGGIANLFSINADRKREKGGVLIAGDLRMWSLKVGEDYVDMVREMDPQARQLFQQVGIDLFLIHAKHRFYVAEIHLEDAVAASLSLTIDQLQNLKSALNVNDKIELGIGMALLSDISNIGALSEPKHNIRRRCFMPPATNEKSARDEFLAAQGYHPIYEVRGQISKLEHLATIKTDLSMELENISKQKDREKTITDFKKCVDAKIE